MPDAFQTTKSLLQSKVFWSATVAFLAAVAPMFGLGVTGEDVANVSTHISGLLDRGVELIGILGTIYFRTKSTQKVTLTGK